MSSRAYISQLGLEGAILVLCPLPLLLLLASPAAGLHQWQAGMAALSSVLCASCAFTIFRTPKLGKTLGILGALASYSASLPNIAENPFIALGATVLLIALLFFMTDFRPSFTSGPSDHQTRCRQRARGGLLALPGPIFCYFLQGTQHSVFAQYCVWLSLIIAAALYFHYSLAGKAIARTIISLAAVASALVIAYQLTPGYHPAIALFINLAGMASIPKNNNGKTQSERWWEMLLNHPARIMLTTFLSLCVLGTFLLSLPIAARDKTIGIVDAAFTSVSSVCVTGLIVLDTPHDFSLFGQICILLLIQLGGLGIMSIATVAINIMGRRLSLSHERLLTSMTDTRNRDLMGSLTLILKFTAATELIGAATLSLLFYAAGDPPGIATWRGIFTAVSAFCNAGFALQSDSLIPYQQNGLVLHTISLLIILGGLAPATCLMIPGWLGRKKIPAGARIALSSTIILLIAGTGFFLAFEWNGVLAHLPLLDKIQNSWFQSVTLRTAGFNSVDISTVGNPVLLIMNLFMFIGGSPGGTAGGVKTTTITILALTFWANITNQREIVTRDRRVNSAIVFRAVTIVISGMIVWIVVVLMLEVTQQLPGRELIFEATSALGTAGLSVGATPLLDEIGKIIIILAMFIGRIGPLTLFMLLSNDRAQPTSRYPDEDISLT